MKEIPLTQGKVALVDDDMYEYLNQWKWYARKNKYHHEAARCNENNETILMHRIILNAPDGIEVRHVNDDRLNNTRKNLTLCSSSESKQGRRLLGATGYIGVTWHKLARKWRAQIGVGKKKIYLGLFADEKEAAIAYDEAAKEHFGEFARLNFPNGAWK